jgi:hypothetical protein
MNYRDLKKLIPPKKEEGTFDTFWFVVKCLFAFIGCGALSFLFLAMLGYPK